MTKPNAALPLVAINPMTGAHLRPATDAECAAYAAGNAGRVLDRPVRVGDVLVDEGPGLRGDNQRSMGIAWV